MRLDKTSNPAFIDYFWENDPTASKKMSVTGILLKSLFSLLIVAAIVVYVWNLYVSGTDIKWFVIGGMIAAIVLSIVISVKNQWAKFLVHFTPLPKVFFLVALPVMRMLNFPIYLFKP